MTRRSLLRGLALLVLVCGAVSFARLRDLPVFGDEAIFLRLARLARSDPHHHLWSSLRAAAAPLHTWLLAAALPLSADTVWSGRAVSVFAGLAAIVAIAWTVRRAVCVFDKESVESASWTAFGAAALLALSPFFFSTRRLARVDALFALETILVAGASLSVAKGICEGPGPRALRAGAGFGALMGILMLTRTAISYPFWLLPVFAILLWPSGTPGAARRAALSFGASLLIGLGLFAPYLLASAPEDLMTRLFHLPATRPAISFPARIHLALANARAAADAFWAYLSPPVLLAAAAAPLLLAFRSRSRLLGFLAAWEAVALLPAVLFARDYFPRYALPAAVPCLAAAAIGLGTLRRTPGLAAAAAAVFLAGPIVDSARFVLDWRAAPWMPIDRWQFVSGWPAGSASQRAADFLANRGSRHPSLVLTPEISGNPTDTIWLLLEGRRGIHLAFAYNALREPLRFRTPAQQGRWLVREDLLLGGNTRAIADDDGLPVLFVSPDPILTLEGWRPAEAHFGRLNPGLTPLARFENPPPTAGQRPTDAVAVFEVR